MMIGLLRRYGYKQVGVVVVVVNIALLYWIHGYFVKMSLESEVGFVSKQEMDTAHKVYEIATERMSTRVPGRLPPWEARSLLSQATDETLQVFRQTLSHTEFVTLMEILRTFKRTCEDSNLMYMLYGGSMVGAYRHAGMVPWDDDVDVWMDIDQQKEAWKFLSQIPKHTLHQVEGKKSLWKLTRDMPKSDKIPFKKDFPFLHIIFFAENSTHVIDAEDQTVFSRSDIFPVRAVLFENEGYFVPNNMLAVMKRKYGEVNMCTPRTCANSTVRVPCEMLYPFYPFITRTEGNIQRLMFGGRLIWEKVTEN